MKIALVGYMGSGKSTVGKVLSRRLNLNFIDLDQEIEQRENLKINEIFSKLGEIKFRKIEHLVLNTILETQQNSVLAIGGGTPAYFDNMKMIKQKTTSVYLRANPGWIMQNIKQEELTRPLIAHLSEDQLPEFIAKHLFERSFFYEQADFQINVQNKSIDEITEEIIRLSIPVK